MAQPGNFTPILLYSSSTPTNVPLAANLTNSANGAELAINIADKNLFFKDSGGTVNTVPIRQSSTSSNGWLSNTDWNTFNGKAPATSGTSLLYGNGSGGFSNVTIGTGITFAGGTLSATGSGGTVTSVTGTSPVVSSGGTTPAISLATAYGDTLNPYASKTANYILAAPNGSAGVPTFRALVAADVTGLGTMATQNANSVTITGGTLNGVAIGGTTAGDGTFDILTTNVSRLGNSTATYYQATNGLVSTGVFTATPPSDGIVIDYSTGFGRFSNFAGDGYQWYNAGVATTKLMELSSAGALATLGTVTANGVLLTGNTGTVTSVAALTLGTTGTDLSSTVANGTTTPVITLNVPTASATNRGALSAADWTTFNNKQPAGTYVTSVTGTAPVVSSGGTTPAISMAAATASVSGYLTSTDWNTFNNKTSNTGTVTSVAASVPSFLSISGSPITTSGTLAITYSGTALPIANGGTNQTAYTSPQSGVAGLVWFDGTSFQNDATTSHVGYNPTTNTFWANQITLSNALTVGNGGTGLNSLTAGYVPFGAGTSPLASNSLLYWDNTNIALGVGITDPVGTYATLGGLVVGGTGGATGRALTILSTSSTATNFPKLYFYHAGHDTSAIGGGEGFKFLQGTTEYARINYGGGLSIGATTNCGNGNLLVSNSVGLGNVTMSGSGIGVQFPATQSASTDVNTLDDYEEGTYTATLVPETSGTITLNGAVNTMTYTKIGRLVTVTGLVQVSATSTPVGTYVKLNLPFTSLNNAYAAQCGGAASRIPSLSSIPLATPFIIGWNSANLFLYYTASTTATNDQINFSFTYVTA